MSKADKRCVDYKKNFHLQLVRNCRMFTLTTTICVSIIETKLDKKPAALENNRVFRTKCHITKRRTDNEWTISEARSAQFKKFDSRVRFYLHQDFENKVLRCIETKVKSQNSKYRALHGWKISVFKTNFPTPCKAPPSKSFFVTYRA